MTKNFSEQKTTDVDNNRIQGLELLEKYKEERNVGKENKNEYEQAISLLTPSAQLGNPKAQYHVGVHEMAKKRGYGNGTLGILLICKAAAAEDESAVSLLKVKGSTVVEWNSLTKKIFDKYEFGLDQSSPENCTKLTKGEIGEIIDVIAAKGKKIHSNKSELIGKIIEVSAESLSTSDVIELYSKLISSTKATGFLSRFTSSLNPVESKSCEIIAGVAAKKIADEIGVPKDQIEFDLSSQGTIDFKFGKLGSELRNVVNEAPAKKGLFSGLFSGRGNQQTSRLPSMAIEEQPVNQTSENTLVNNLTSALIGSGIDASFQSSGGVCNIHIAKLDQYHLLQASAPASSVKNDASKVAEGHQKAASAAAVSAGIYQPASPIEMTPNPISGEGLPKNLVKNDSGKVVEGFKKAESAAATAKIYQPAFPTVITSDKGLLQEPEKRIELQPTAADAIVFPEVPSTKVVLTTKPNKLKDDRNRESGGMIPG